MGLSRPSTFCFGTTSVQLSERNNGELFPKRHQVKHFGFCTFIVRDQGVGGSNPLSPTIFLSLFQTASQSSATSLSLNKIDQQRLFQGILRAATFADLDYVVIRGQFFYMYFNGVAVRPRRILYVLDGDFVAGLGKLQYLTRKGCHRSRVRPRCLCCTQRAPARSSR